METREQQRTKLSAYVGKEIRKLLIDLDLKQGDLAARIGENEMWVSRRLRGVQEIGLNDLERIADGLNVEVADLLPKREGKLIAVGGTSGATRRESKPWNFLMSKRPGPSGPPSRTAAAVSTERTGRVSAALAA